MVPAEFRLDIHFFSFLAGESWCRTRYCWGSCAYVDAAARILRRDCKGGPDEFGIEAERATWCLRSKSLSWQPSAGSRLVRVCSERAEEPGGAAMGERQRRLPVRGYTKGRWLGCFQCPGGRWAFGVQSMMQVRWGCWTLVGFSAEALWRWDAAAPFVTPSKLLIHRLGMNHRDCCVVAPGLSPPREKPEGPDSVSQGG